MPQISDENKPAKQGASVAVFDKKRVLLVKRGKEPLKGYWSLPGGAIETNETPMEAAVRELREETRLVVSEPAFVTKFRAHRIVDGRTVSSKVEINVFVTASFSGTAVASDDAADLAWATFEELEDYLLTPRAGEVIEMARRVMAG